MHTSVVDRRHAVESLLSSLEGELVEDVGVDELVAEFVDATDQLSATERAELLGSVIAAERVDFGQIARGIQTGLSLFQTGAQVVGGLVGALGGNNRTTQNVALWANRLGQGAGMINTLVGGLAQRQIPPLPGRPPLPSRGPTPGAAAPRAPAPRAPAPRAPAPRAPAPRAPTPRAPAPRAPTPRAPTPTSPAPPPAPRAPGTGTGTVNATALLSMLLNNPQLRHMITSAAVAGRRGARELEIEVPGAHSSVGIPVEALVEAISLLAQESTHELGDLARSVAGTYAQENLPQMGDYLIGEDGEWIVDPSSAEQRAALVVHYLRIGGEMARRQNDGDGDLESWALF